MDLNLFLKFDFEFIYVPQDFRLNPLSLILATLSPQDDLIHLHLFADDSQIQISCAHLSLYSLIQEKQLVIILTPPPSYTYPINYQVQM